MSENTVAVIHSIGKGKCELSGKTAEGACITIPNTNVKEKFFSRRKLWDVLKLVVGEDAKDESPRRSS